MNPIPCLLLLFPGVEIASVENTSRFDAPGTVAESLALVERHHLRKPRVDERMSARWFEGFVAELDPRRLYFLKADLLEWRDAAPKLASAAREGDLALPRRVVERFRGRVATAMEYARAAVDAEHDFAIDESCPRSFDDWAADETALRERWRLDLKRELLLDKLVDIPLEDSRSRLRSRHERLAAAAEGLGDERLVTCLLNALLHGLAPRDAYLSPSHLDQFNGGFLAEYRIGLHLERRRGRWFVRRTLDWSFSRPLADELVGWEVLAVRRIDGTFFDVVEMPADELGPLLTSPLKGLGTDTEILLELYNPVTTKRTTLGIPRLADR